MIEDCLEKYKKINSFENKYLKFMSKKDVRKFYILMSIYWGIVIIGFAGLIIISFLKELRLFGIIIIIISILVGIKTIKYFTIFLDAKRQWVAENHYEVENTKEVQKIKQKEFEKFLITKNINSIDQIDYFINNMLDNKIKRETPYNTIVLGGIGVFILPIWNEFIKLMYKNSNVIQAMKWSIILVVIISMAYFSFNQILVVIEDVRKRKIYELERMKMEIMKLRLEKMNDN